MTPVQRLLIAVAVSALVAAVPGAAPIVAAGRILAPALIESPEIRALIARNAIAARRIDVPADLRRLNWVSGKQGSCVHASLYHLLQWQGQSQLAAWWKASHGGGDGPDGIEAGLDAAGIDYSMIRNGDEAFLEWAIRTRRAVNVTQQAGWHMVTLVDIDQTTATILDSNYPDRLITKSRAAFLADWRQQNPRNPNSNVGWAFTTLFDPPAPPPKPWKILLANKDA